LRHERYAVQVLLIPNQIERRARRRGRRRLVDLYSNERVSDPLALVCGAVIVSVVAVVAVVVIDVSNPEEEVVRVCARPNPEGSSIHIENPHGSTRGARDVDSPVVEIGWARVDESLP